jgi:uroporphyrinogen-III decarboxylase
MTSVERVKSIHNFEKVDHLYRREFYIWEETEQRWKNEGWNGDYSIFNYDAPDGLICSDDIMGEGFLGWTDAPIVPCFKEEIVKRTEKHEYYRLSTGEIRKYPIGGRTAVMPLFVEASVESREDWEKTVKFKLDPFTPERWAKFDEKKFREIREKVDKGQAIFTARFIGGYMYLRSLCGPEKLLYLFYDEPELIHDMMKTWLALMTECLTKLQDCVPFFKLHFGEDIAYKLHTLISPKMFEEFLEPYYNELFQTIKSRQKEFIHIELDCDGNPDILMPYYIRNGITAVSPCEVAAGFDVVAMGRKYPETIFLGGIDKRKIALDKDEIKKEVDRVIPAMKKRGGYIPMFDHGVPPDVSFENYLFYRRYITSIDDFS